MEEEPNLSQLAPLSLICEIDLTGRSSVPRRNMLALQIILIKNYLLNRTFSQFEPY